jgi:hypothetical protein
VVAEDPLAVEHELCRVWSDNLTLGVPAHAKFDWLYHRAPNPADVVFVLKARGPDGHERIVGTNGLAVRRFQVAGQEVWAAVSADLAVDREHRALLPALKLVRAWRAHAAGAFELAFGFPNNKADGVLLRAGFRELGKTHRYVRVLRHEGYAARLRERETLPALVRRALSLPWVVRLGAHAIDAGRLLLASPALAKAAARYRLLWREDPDPRCDALFAEARHGYDIVGVRSRDFLGWRYPRARFACVERRRDGALVAYAVVERDEATGAAHVRDFFGHPEVFGTALDLLVPAMALAGAHSLSVRFLGAPRVAAVLESRGFALRPGGERTVVVEIGTRLREHAAVITNPDCWHLFDVDEDA